MDTLGGAQESVKPTVVVCGSESLVTRIGALGWDVTVADDAGAAAARAAGAAVIDGTAADLDDGRLAAHVAGTVASALAGQLVAFRALAKKSVHDARNSVALLWMNLSALERAATATPPDGPAVDELVKEIKAETREVVSLLDRLAVATGGSNGTEG